MIELNFKLKRKNFDVEINEVFPKGITGIYGPSGSGKTSLINAVSGLVKPSEGKIKIGNRTVFDSEKGINVEVEKRNIGYVFQEGRLFPHMNIEKNLRYGIKDKANHINFDELVDLLNLRHLLSSKPSQVSGGERQRAALGRALLSSPEILLLDEPFSAVDVNLRQQILPFILKIQKKVDIPILIVSHDLSDLLKLSSKLCLIKEGKIQAHDEYYNLLKDPKLISFFGTTRILNVINMKVEEINKVSGLSLLSYPNTSNNIHVKCESSKHFCSAGQELKVFIQADDIALSKHKLEELSIQNQIEGQVAELIKNGSSYLCEINAGFKLVVEITASSKEKLGLEKGSKVFCLFKTVAIDVLN